MRFETLVGSIRFRITAIAALVVAVVLTATAFALVAAQRSQLTANIDVALEQRIAGLQVLVENTDGIPSVLPGEGDAVAQLLVDGVVVAASANIAGDGPIEVALLENDVPSVATVDRETYRVIAGAVTVGARQGTVVVGLNDDEVEDAAEVLTTSLAVGVPVVVVLLAGLVWVLVGRTLAPVDAIRRRVDTIGDEGIDRRVPVPETNDEIARLASTMNQMLDRLEASIVRQRSFVGDASHELRSPLTRLRTMLEVELGAPEHEPPEAVYSSLLDEVVGMQLLVEGLLELARGDSDRGSTTTQLDLDDVVRAEVRDARAQGRCPIDATRVEPVMVSGDASGLARAVRNLLGNATRHADSSVSVELFRQDGQAVLVVSDDGPGIPLDKREFVFERFTRLDDARTQSTGGAGLGLAITRGIVDRHGGSVRIDDAPGGGTRVELRIAAL